jgi:hypothetical protein
MEEWDRRFPLQSYLERSGIICKNLAQYKKAQRQLDKEEEEKKKNSQPLSR